MGVLPEGPANLALEECCRRIWEALDGSVDAYVLDTGEARPFPSLPWGSLSVNARRDFIGTICILMPGLAEGVRITHAVNGTA